jgi:hypothetical protein
MDAYDFMIRNGRLKYITSAITPVDDDDEQREECGKRMRGHRARIDSIPPYHREKKDKPYASH